MTSPSSRSRCGASHALLPMYFSRMPAFSFIPQICGSALLYSKQLPHSPPGFPASNLASKNKGMGKVKLFPTPEYSSKQSSDPVVPLVPCTGIFLGPSKSGKTVALISLILEQYRGVFERIYIFSPSINWDRRQLDSRQEVHRAGPRASGAASGVLRLAGRRLGAGSASGEGTGRGGPGASDIALLI